MSSWRAGVLPAIPAGGAFAGRGGDLGAPVSYLGTEPLQLGPLVGAQRSIVRHSATFLLANTMAPSPMEMDAVITQIV